MPLKFEGPQVLRWNDGSEEEIEGTYVTEGTLPEGSMWAMVSGLVACLLRFYSDRPIGD